MRDLLATISSMIVILICLSLLMMSGETDSGESINNANLLASYQSKQPPAPRTTLFKKVQSVTLEQRVLVFITSEKTGLKEHYFLIHDKNVVLINSMTGDLPQDTIRFDYDCSTLLVTIPAVFNIDIMESLTSSY